MLGLASDKGSKRTAKDSTKKLAFFSGKKKKKALSQNEVIPAEESAVIFKEDTEPSKSEFKAVSLLEGIVFDTSSLELDDYVRWLAENSKNAGALPVISCIHEYDFVGETIKQAVMNYNNGDYRSKFLKDENEKLSNIVPATMEVKIF